MLQSRNLDQEEEEVRLAHLKGAETHGTLAAWAVIVRQTLPRKLHQLVDHRRTEAIDCLVLEPLQYAAVGTATLVLCYIYTSHCGAAISVTVEWIVLLFTLGDARQISLEIG